MFGLQEIPALTSTKILQLIDHVYIMYTQTVYIQRGHEHTRTGY